jgi:transposase InsO family protein
VSEAKRLKALEDENAKLTRLLADAMRDGRPRMIVSDNGAEFTSNWMRVREQNITAKISVDSVPQFEIMHQARLAEQPALPGMGVLAAFQGGQALPPPEGMSYLAHY